MAFDATTTPATDDATKLGDYTRLRDCARALVGATAGVIVLQGGDLDAFITDTSEVTLPKAFGDVGAEIDGTFLGFSGVTVVLEVAAMRHQDVGSTVTCTVDLYNVTDAAAVASSAVAISLSTGSVTHQKSTALTLPTSAKRFRFRIKTSDAAKAVAAIARVVVKGA
jgi:hypothetical protein